MYFVPSQHVPVSVRKVILLFPSSLPWNKRLVTGKTIHMNKSIERQMKLLNMERYNSPALPWDLGSICGRIDSSKVPGDLAGGQGSPNCQGIDVQWSRIHQIYIEKSCIQETLNPLMCANSSTFFTNPGGYLV